MTERLFTLAVVAAVLLAAVGPDGLSANDKVPAPADLEFFEKKIRPLFVANCFNCHSANTQAHGGLRLDDRTGALQGGGRGLAIKPGDPEASLILKAVSHTDDKLKMPPDGKLSDAQIADLREWIQNGAAWPVPVISIRTDDDDPDRERLRKEHWAWQPLREVPVPQPRDPNWPRDDVDRFILSHLEAQGLPPVADADRATLLRRVTFDLTGLPPSLEEQAAFQADESPHAFATAVDRLLHSVAFGERWGRHWLDVARFGESTGSARNIPYPQAWKYRDYVIDSFNKDKPYSHFLQEQIAGDLLPAATPAEREEHLIATGFLALGVKDVNQRFKVRFVMDNIDEQIDTVTRSVLALTASCARCHDHKFDPISMREYYALAGIFQSTDLCAGVRNKMGGGGLDYYDLKSLVVLSKKEDPSDLPARIEAAKTTAAEAKAEFERLRDSPEGGQPGPNGRPKRQMARQKWNRLQAEFDTLSDPLSRMEVALGVREAAEIRDAELRIRGEAERLGPTAPRGFLKVVQYPGQPPITPQQSGRLQLAQWLTSPRNPLASRVIVNRVWSHLFGAGIVRSVDNFGVMGELPSHPELLDHLAERFIRDGGSLKRLIRTLVLTRTYQLSSAATPVHLAADPANRWLWRHSPRRLAAEEIRDSLLAVAGRLDRSRPQGSPAKELKVVELNNNGPEAKRLIEFARDSRHRSVYLPLLRTLVPSSLDVFDFAEQGMVTGSRETTTVAPQALFLLNDELVRKSALALAESLLARSDLDDPGRTRRAYRLALGRDPTTAEIERIQKYIVDDEAATNAALAAKQEQATDPAEAAADPTAAVTGQVVNPDDVDQSDPPVPEGQVRAANPHSAAWASALQALLGSAEFLHTR